MPNALIQRLIPVRVFTILTLHKSALIASLCGSAVVILLSMVIQSHIRDLSQQAAEKALTTVAETTEEALVAWLEREKEEAGILAGREEIRNFTRDLLEVKRSGGDLLNAPAQIDQRAWLASDLAANHHRDFFLVALDNINISSTRNANIGKTNLLSQQGDFLQRIKLGETLMSLPLRSEVPLTDENGTLIRGVPTMFVGAPVRDEESRIIATLLFRIDPNTEFMSVLKRGRIGTSGESYAFDKTGRMLSISRFLDQLKDVGLVDPEASDNLDIRVEDPGANLIAGEQDRLKRADRPLTLMASEATSGVSGSNLIGYRDYRGVPVIGVWRWIDELNLGITSEIDVAEVYELSRNYQAIIGTATAVIVALLVSMLMISSYNRSRIVVSNTRYRRLFNETNDAIVITDARAGRVLDINERAWYHFQYSREEIVGMRLRDLYHASDQDVFDAAMKDLDLKGHAIFEAALVRKDGSIYQGEISANFAELEEGLVIQAFIRNITDRKRLEEQLGQVQRMETIGSLAGGVAHEFNNLLLPIIGNAQLITMNVDKDSKLEVYAERIVSAGKRGSRLVAQLLSLGSDIELDQVATNLPEVLHEAVRLVRSSIPPSIHVTTDIDETCRAVNANADQVHQIIRSS